MRILWLFLLFIGLITWRFHVYESHFQAPLSSGFLSFKADVLTAVDLRQHEQQFVVEHEGRLILVKASPFIAIQVGDSLQVSGIVTAPKDDPEKVFSYRQYLLMDGIQNILEVKAVQVEAIGVFDLWRRGELRLFFLRGLSNVRAFFEAQLARLYVEPELGLVSGLILGSRAGLAPYLSEAFRRAGLMHLIAVSGYNISLVVTACSAVLSFLPFRRRLLWSAIGVFAFVFLVGASASVVRAALMGSLALFSQFTGRRSAALFGLLWAALLMGVWNPYRVVYDIGFQLSFGATLGLLLLNPLLKSWLEQSAFVLGWARFPESIRESALLSLSAQIMTLPITAYYFQSFSWVTLFANIAVAPLLPLAMAFSGLSLLLPPASVLTFLVLRALEAVALFFASLPGALLELPFSAPMVFAFYAGLALLLLRSYKSTLVRAFRR